MLFIFIRNKMENANQEYITYSYVLCKHLNQLNILLARVFHIRQKTNQIYLV